MDAPPPQSRCETALEGQPMSRSDPRRSTQPEQAHSAARAGHELAMALRAAYLSMHRRANAALALFKLTADQFVLLTTLAEGDGVTQKELVQRTTSDPNTMSEMLGRLERRGLIARERHADDGRALRVSLTASGRELQRRAWDGAAAPFCGALAGLVPADEVGALVGHLGGIAGGMLTSGSPPDRDAGTAPPPGSG